jgi:hypothetical protein
LFLFHRVFPDEPLKRRERLDPRQMLAGPDHPRPVAVIGDGGFEAAIQPVTKAAGGLTPKGVAIPAKLDPEP